MPQASTQFRQITGYGWKYVLNVNPDSHKSLEKQFEGRRRSGQVKEMRRTDSKGLEHYFAWTTELCLCESAVDVKVNYLMYEQRDKEGKVTRWSWITNLPLRASTVERVMRAGLRTKAKLWESLRSLFKVQLFRSMSALYRRMAYLYGIQLK